MGYCSLSLIQAHISLSSLPLCLCFVKAGRQTTVPPTCEMQSDVSTALSADVKLAPKVMNHHHKYDKHLLRKTLQKNISSCDIRLIWQLLSPLEKQAGLVICGFLDYVNISVNCVSLFWLPPSPRWPSVISHRLSLLSPSAFCPTSSSSRLWMRSFCSVEEC